MKRVLVICPNIWDTENLARPSIRRNFELSFCGEELLETPGLFAALRFDVLRYIRAIVESHRGSDLAGVLGTGDYPGCMIAAETSKALGLPAPDPRDVLLLSHKFYSREIQRSIVPDATPSFVAIDPSGKPRAGDPPSYPLFIKPVKGTMSIRARAVNGPEDLPEAVHLSLRERILAHVLLRPFQQMLRAYGDGEIPGHFFIGERLLCGEQVTVDGFVDGSRAVIMGVVDSVMYPGTASFRRFEYPSRLPTSVRSRMAEIATRVVEGSGFRHGCFNIEMFHEPTTGAIHIIEINPRMSYQFADLYEKVDGTNTYDVQLALATGQTIAWRSGGGEHAAAASFVMRRFQDAEVLSVPSAADIAAVARRFPGTTVKILCRAGERLSDHDQDVASYRYGIVNMGAPAPDELLRRYEEVERLLPFAFR